MARGHRHPLAGCSTCWSPRSTTTRTSTGIRGYAEDSGEGRWTVEAAIEHAVPLPAIAASLFARFASRQDDSPAMKAVAAMRNQFGGHAVQADERPASEQDDASSESTSAGDDPDAAG